MPEFYDTLETRSPEAREGALLGRLPELISRARQAPGWAKQLAGVDAHRVTSRAALATLPVLRKSDLKERQRLDPPFGGLALAAPGSLKRLLMSPGPIFEPQGQGADFWGAARALFAAGFRSGDIVHNAFAYQLTPGGFIVESGAHALGCAVIPAGVGNTEQQVEAIAHFKPSGYAGTPDFLKILLDTAHRLGADVASLTRALVSGAALPPSLAEFPLTLADDGCKLIYTYDTRSEHTGITDLLDALRAADVRFKDLATTQTSLEDIFVSLVRNGA